jgi:hypothetical protein
MVKYPQRLCAVNEGGLTRQTYFFVDFPAPGWRKHADHRSLLRITFVQTNRTMVYPLFIWSALHTCETKVPLQQVVFQRRQAYSTLRYKTWFDY